MGAPEVVGAPEEESPEEVTPEEESPEERTIPSGLLKNVLIAASVGAGAIHLWAGWAHSGITRVLVFFVVVAAVQLWLAAVVVWVPSIPWSVLIGGAVANAAVVVVWVLSRTTGVPFQPSAQSMEDAFNAAAANPGPDMGFIVHAETFGLFDTTASVLEIAVVVAVLLLWRRRRRPDDESGIDATAAVEADAADDSAATVSREVR